MTKIPRTTDELVREARSRIGAMRIAPPAGLESSRAAADELAAAIDALQMSLPVGDTYDFYEIVAKVEERFRKAYDREVVANAKTEAQMEAHQVSTGWWIVLSRAGIAVRTGDTKPEYEAGDTVVLKMARLRKKTAEPELAIVPPAPPRAPGTATIKVPAGYDSPEAFAKDCGFELAP